ncbi:MAG TPA: SDR family NAD(P)-dependent oxidoreductase [Smithella sp.]|nr:SDR family NAD(P)-dependent oxidoreductase [Smithella sp.]MDM7987690.1 SDR family NAD(P)-dependent oxidoreductase [Smithella sp.]HNY49039.1 SDR family NAD(P)-dependent oxidoreductase [Smithella sp.]HOG89994.1 SDR family NAD(P)-dependent oxidoreductase [Smithella sp.]HOU50538.1 SDR family NAD(P)-dependent oxidoreductase [Smithella sp.]
MKLSLKGKNVLVTGAAMGIGRGLSECFAKEGANLILVDLPGQKELLERWTAELHKNFRIITWTFYRDLTESDGPERLYEQVVRAVPEVHVLVNNAGICWFGRFSEMPLEKLNAMILLNCLAYAKMSRLFLPAMIGRNEGGILNISSVSAFQPVPTLGLYASTKALTQSLTEAIRAELPGKSKVVVSTLNPPFTRTHLIEDAGIPLDYIPVKMSFMSVEDVVSSGVKAFMRGKERYVPGFFNRIFYLGLSKFTPHTLLNRFSRLLTRRLSDFIPVPVMAFFNGLKSK